MKKSLIVLSLVFGLLNAAQAFFPQKHVDPHANHKSESGEKKLQIQTAMGEVFNFSIPRDKPLETCLKVEISMTIDIDYPKIDGTLGTKRFELGDVNEYKGVCNATINTLEIIWRDSWTLGFNFKLVEKLYQLESISLNYTVDSINFPNVTDIQKGNQWFMASDLGLFSTVTGNSFKCRSDTRVVSNDKRGVIVIKNYHGQPFMSGEAGKPREFGTAVECIGDKFNANKLVPIIVGSVLSALVLIILVSYIVGRRKHRSTPGYQQV